MNEKNQLSRIEYLLGSQAIEKLKSSTVAIFGIGGVGGYVAEALARSGVGHLVLIDKDTVSLTNINRQIIALHSTVGRDKVDVMRERIADIDPTIKVDSIKCFFLPETAELFDFDAYDYVIDAVDTVKAKLHIITTAKAHNVPVISSMGAGNKLDPTKFEVADIYDTSADPLARVMRKECKARGIDKLKVVYSTELASEPKGTIDEEPDPGRRSVPGSVAFVPSVAGLILAGEVVKDIVNE